MITKFVLMNKQGEYLHHRRVTYTHDVHYAWLINSEILAKDYRDRLHKEDEVIKLVFQPVQMIPV